MSRVAWESMDDIGPYLNSGTYVWLLYDFPNGGPRPVLGAHRTDMFWGSEALGWWGKEEIMWNGRPTHGMWIDAWIKGWKRYCDYQEPLDEPSANA